MEQESEALANVGARGLAPVESALKEILEKFKGLPARGSVTAGKHFPAREALCLPFPPGGTGSVYSLSPGAAKS